MSENTPSIHLAGIGGAGMSAIAQVLIDRGETVSGSDRLLDHGQRTPILSALEKQGAMLTRQDGSGIHPGTKRLIYSTAIEDDNPELAAARRHGIPIAHRAAELVRLSEKHRLIAVTGTSGKSTVTAMLGWLLAKAQLDPCVVNGATMDWRQGSGRVTSVRRGAGSWMVIEADESDRSLLGFQPEHAIITNCTADHFDLPSTEKLFDTFRRQVSGIVIDTQPPPGSITTSGLKTCFQYEGHSFEVPLAGYHNAANAAQAVLLAHRALGIDPALLASAITSFPGVDRRLQFKGICPGGGAVIDDYAHNPDKLRASLSAVAAAFPRIAVLWRPHGYASLRNNLAKLAEVLPGCIRPQDIFLLLPVYDAGGSADRSINSNHLAALLREQGTEARLVADLVEGEELLRQASRADTALMVCGARDPGLTKLASRLSEPLKEPHNATL